MSQMLLSILILMIPRTTIIRQLFSHNAIQNPLPLPILILLTYAKIITKYHFSPRYQLFYWKNFNSIIYYYVLNFSGHIFLWPFVFHINLCLLFLLQLGICTSKWNILILSSWLMLTIMLVILSISLCVSKLCRCQCNRNHAKIKKAYSWQRFGRIWNSHTRVGRSAFYDDDDMEDER